MANVGKQVRAYQRQAKDGWRLAWVELALDLPRSEDHPFASIDELREQLRVACEAGLVRASGVSKSLQMRKAIDAVEFVGAEIWHGDGTSLHQVVNGRGSPAAWLELRFDSNDVQKLRTPQAPTSTQTKKQRRTQHDSEAFITRAVEILDYEGGFGAFTRAQLQAQLEIWCGERWPKVPSRSWMWTRFDEAETRYLDGLSN